MRIEIRMSPESRFRTPFIFFIMRGIFIPEEILRLKTLNHTEMLVLSIYKYYTEEGRLKCCKLPNEEIYQMLGMGERTFQRVKKHLKGLGYIQSNGGVSVRYSGVNGCDNGDTQVSKLSSKGDTCDTGSDKTDTRRVTNLSSKGDTCDTHNKEKRKKENKKEEKRVETNFDRVVEYLSYNYDTYYSAPDTISLIKETFKKDIYDINNLDYEKCDVIKIASQIRNYIDKYKPKKVEEHKEETRYDWRNNEDPELLEWMDNLDWENLDLDNC